MQPLLENGWNISELENVINHLQKLEGGPEGYRLRRIILANFWLYETQIFEIPHGRIFLGGENASGKSTVLTAALPLILDGHLRADRLDTFGKQDRRIEYYVLGNEESSTPFMVPDDKRTSYIAMEFEWSDLTLPPIAPEIRQRWENGKEESARYLTLGLSIAGNRNAARPITPLYFLITDGNRLIEDIPLPGPTNERNTINKFKEALKVHGILCNTQREYEQYVSQYLFGFKEVKTFHKLIALLLTLRQPNLSSTLNLEDVRMHLTNSLLTIPEEITRQAIETILTIEDLRARLDQLKNEYQKAEELENAQQALVTQEARVAFQYYKSSQKYSIQLDQEIKGLQTQIRQGEEQLQQLIQRHAEVNQDKQETHGAILALEQSEGIKVAEQIVILQERVQREREQVKQQQQSVISMQEAMHSHTQMHSRQSTALQNDLDITITQLNKLYKTAAEKAIWQEGAFQLQYTLEQISGIHTPSLAARGTIENSIQALHLNDEQHLAWLYNLQKFHQKKASLEQDIEKESQYERDKHAEGEEQFKHFKTSLSQFNLATQYVNRMLEQIHLASTQQSIHESEDGLPPLLDDTQHQENKRQIPQEVSDSTWFIDEATKQLQNCKNGIEAMTGILNRIVTRTRQNSNNLQIKITALRYEHKILQQRYQQMLNEPEYVPMHPERRNIARKHLVQHGIPAFPLYTLINFMPEITSEERGRIEYILEDAGVLDALVLNVHDIPAADALLLAENVSDYRIKSEMMQDSNSNGDYSLHLLCFDEAIRTSLPGERIEWEIQINRILSIVEQNILMSKAKEHTQSIGHWEHGLLSGQSGSGTSKCIGRATRLKVREQELDNIKRELIDLGTQLDDLDQRHNQYEKQADSIQQNLTQLQTLSTDSHIDSNYTEAQTIHRLLVQAHKRYLDAQAKTKQKRQQHLHLVDELEQISQPYPPFAQNNEKVSTAINSTSSLISQVETCRRDLRKMIQAYEEMEYTQQLLQRAEQDKNMSIRLLEQLQNQLFQNDAALEELQKLAEVEKVEDLSQRLHELRAKAKTLEDTLLGVFKEKTVLEMSLQSLPEKLKETENRQQDTSRDVKEKHTHLEKLIFLYPIKTLIAARSYFEKGNDSEVEHILWNTAQRDSIPFNIDGLKALQQEAWYRLEQTFSNNKQVLSNYSPELSIAKMRITFYHENGLTPFELLNDLEQNIDMQKELLQKEEKELFEQFLLEEMAEVIRKHIAEANDWVKNINTALDTMQLVGDRYELEWQPKHSFEDIQVGRNLANHLALFRKRARDLSEDNRAELKNAFLQEIRGIWSTEDAVKGRNFEQILQDIFDYRKWFQFKIYITPTGGQKQQLTQKLLGGRSGAEQLFALYVPLLAALTALYNSAAKGAPRLLGLDEAFDKASANNMQLIIEFLVKQDFQWIMTGPQLNISGIPAPVIMRYLMLHEKGIPVATAIPQIWQSRSVKNDRH